MPDLHKHSRSYQENITDDAPVIIIGMHRSGTTMIAEMLSEAGLFQGRDKDPNHEPVFFMEINDWLLRTAGGAWDQPKPFKYLMENSAALDKAVNFISGRLKSRHAASFFGTRKWPFLSPANPPKGQWGWKDPRNTITLPFWLKLFPKARVININRHGVDVAASLLYRNGKDLQALLTGKKGVSRRNPLIHLRPSIVVDSLRCSTLEGAFSLWEEYMEAATSHSGSFENRWLSISYEDFIASPCEHLQKLTEFCSLQLSTSDLQRITASVKKSRSLSFQSDRELSLFAESVAGRLARYGY